MTSPTNDKPAPPVIRYAPLGELRVYAIQEHELEDLSRGSPTSLFLNFSLALLPISITLFVTLTTTTISSDRLFQFYVCTCVITLISGIVLFCLWWKLHRNSKAVVEQIKNRMPPPEGIQETDGA